MESWIKSNDADRFSYAAENLVEKSIFKRFLTRRVALFSLPRFETIMIDHVYLALFPIFFRFTVGRQDSLDKDSLLIMNEAT